MKTRAFDPETGQWRTDYVLAANGTLWAIPEGCNVGWSRYSHMTVGDQLDWKLSKFTGLLDSSTPTKDIYEGDILQSEWGSLHIVQWGIYNVGCEEYPFSVVGPYLTEQLVYQDMINGSMKKIGDIFTTPELLEVK